MRTITLEEHFFTRSFIDAVKAVAPDAIPPNIAALESKLVDIGSGRIADMDASQIDLQVLSLAAIGIEILPAETATPLFHDINDELAEAVRKNPKRFAGFATLALKDPGSAAKELDRCVTQLDFPGALVNGTTDGLFLDDPRFLPVFEAAAHLNVPVYLHPAPPPKAVAEAYYSNLPGIAGQLLSIAGWGWHSEVALHTLRLIVSGVFDRFPTLQLIIGHMGEGLPFALARSTQVLSAAAKSLRQPIDAYFQTNIHITTSGYFTLPPLKCAINVIGLDRMMFSVDYPFSPNVQGRTFMNTIQSMMDIENLAKVSHENAERLLRLPRSG
jgi:hypothetical protein